MAKLYFRYSSMNAGKTLQILSVNYNYKEKNKNTILFTSSEDDRYGVGKITTRVGLSEDAELFGKGIDIYEIVFNLENKPHCVLIDEAQFLLKEHVIQLCKIVDELNIPVICYGLRITYDGKPFEGSSYLLIYADTIEEIKTICECGKKATMNMRIREGKPIFEGETEFIGGNNMYNSVCRKCYFENKNNI